MTIKQFFKSETFKCLLVLLCVALVASGLLAILNDVLHVSEEEKTARAIKAIYNKEVDYDVVELDKEFSDNKYGSIANVYLLEDGNYLINSTGLNGYKNGTVTMWVVASFEDSQFKGISKVTLAGYANQTLMSNFGSSFYDVYSSNNDKILEYDSAYFNVAAGEDNITNVSAGATKSSNAINNSINSALFYIRNALVKEV